MRHGTTGRRHRHRGSNNGGGGRGNGNQNNRMRVFDSNGPDVRIRGTAHQVCEKYLTLAKDASSAGDRVLAESYMQHAEHYQRTINSWEEDVRQRQDTFHSDQPPAQAEVQVGSAARLADPNDLSLPASILGGNAQPQSQDGTVSRTSTLVTA